MGNWFSRSQREKRSLDRKVTRSDAPDKSCNLRKQQKLPDFKPSWRRRRDIIPDSQILQLVDQHAIQTPAAVKVSVSVLAQYLSLPFRSDLEKARAFYRWITENISYSTEEFFNDKVESCEAGSVLKSGKTVCQGFAELFLALCNQVNIPCRLITGFAKDFTYDPNVAFTPRTNTNHAWNLVCVEGAWHHVECTWGAGYIDGKTFVKSFEEIYFLTDPEDFVTAHFPYMNSDIKGSAKYQLLRKPWNLSTFNRRVKVFSSGLECGLTTPSHPDWRVRVSKEVVIELQAVRLRGMMAELLMEGVELPGHCLVRKKEEGIYNVTVRPPTPGIYDLCLFGRDRDVSTIYYSLVNYVLVCSEAVPELHPYPKHRRTQYGATSRAEEYGLALDACCLDSFVSKDGTLHIRLGVTRLMPVLFNLIFAEADLPDLDNYAMATYTRSAVHVLVRLPRVGYYELTVLGKRPCDDSHQYDAVSTLLLECQKGCQDCQPFPVVLKAAAELCCVLAEPLALYLPPDQQVKVQMTSPLLKRVLPSCLRREGDTWRGLVNTGNPGSRLTIYGSQENEGSLKGLFQFQTQ